MFFGPIYENFVITKQKQGLFKKRNVQQKVYSFEITHTGPVGGLESDPLYRSPFAGLAGYVNKTYSFDTLEKTINMKQQLVNLMFINYDLTREGDIPPYHIEKGMFEKDVSYDKEYLHDKFYQYRLNKQGKKCY